MRLSSTENVLLPLIAYVVYSAQETTKKNFYPGGRFGMKTHKSQFARHIKFWRAENIIIGPTAEPLNLTSFALAAAALSPISLINRRITHNTIAHSHSMNEMHIEIR